LLYLTREADVGAKIRVKAGASSAETTTRATPIVQASSPDRVAREEVYEMQWSELRAGTLKLERGTNTLTVQVLTKPGADVMQLKSVLLERR
jgi:hypothetical protein